MILNYVAGPSRLSPFTLRTTFARDAVSQITLIRAFPRAITGSLVHDCFVYAVRWLHKLGRLLSPGSTPLGIANPRIFLVEMPAHVGAMIRADLTFNRHVVISINNKHAEVHELDAGESNETAAEGGPGYVSGNEDALCCKTTHVETFGRKGVMERGLQAVGEEAWPCRSRAPQVSSALAVPQAQCVARQHCEGAFGRGACFVGNIATATRSRKGWKGQCAARSGHRRNPAACRKFRESESAAKARSWIMKRTADQRDQRRPRRQSAARAPRRFDY